LRNLPCPEGVSFATFGGTPKVPQVPLKLTLSGGGKFAYFRGIPRDPPPDPQFLRLSDPSDGAELPFGPESVKTGVQNSSKLMTAPPGTGGMGAVPQVQDVQKRVSRSFRRRG